jgi:hypothetical protein
MEGAPAHRRKRAVLMTRRLSVSMGVTLLA